MKERMRLVRNVVLHILFLIALFCGAVLVFSRMINQVAPDVAETMENSTFPLVYMRNDGTSFNCLHGYAREMDTSYIRDSITPLDADRRLDIQIQAFGASIDGVKYEVTTLDGTESLENTKVVTLDQDGDYLYATLELQNKMLMNQEYMLKIQVTSGGRDIYYYTHVLLADGLHTDDYINYVLGFYDKCVNKTDLSSVSAAVEPDETTDAEQTLAYMDIHDSVDQLTWGNLNPQIYYKPTPRIKEINQNTATLTLDYRIASVNESGVTEIFNVHDAYRLRYTDSRIFVLNLERTTDEVFNPENDVLRDNGINLGITDKEVEYASNERGSVVAFVQENELWSYDVNSETLNQIFSFPQKENMDYRDFYDEHMIHILNVSSQGDVWFAVAGYMNRGNHEGENGVAVYYYESASAMVDEKIFLSSMESPEILERDVNGLAYISQDGSRFFVLLEGNVYEVDLNSRTYQILVSDVAENCYASSASGRYFAWLPEGKEYDSSTLAVMDLETGSRSEVACGSNERIRPVAYMKEDLVFGTARTEDIDASHGGNALFPMYKLTIQNGEGSVVKEYAPNGAYVTEVDQSDNMLTLTRVVKNGETFTEGTQDHIVSTDTEADVSMGVATQTTSRKQTEVLLRVGTSISASSAQVVRSKIVTYSASRTLDIPTDRQSGKLYYVYSLGKLRDVFHYPNEAITEADELLGLVVDEDQNYIWVRGDRDTQTEIDLEDVPAVMTSSTMDLDELQAGIEQQVVDLSGCTLDQVLYFVSQGKPVLAQTAKGPVAVVGYDTYNVFLLDPGGTEWYYGGLNDSTAMFEEAGNIFISYLDTAAE